MRILGRKSRTQGQPLPEWKSGDICIWDDRYAFVEKVGEGPYGSNLTFKMWDNDAIITTTPGLDPRFGGRP